MKLNTIIKSILNEAVDDGGIDQLIMKNQPETIDALETILNRSGVSYKIQKVRYLGYPNGVRVVIKTPDGKTKTLPGNGLVYAIHGWT